jgi:hypothetical protein
LPNVHFLRIWRERFFAVAATQWLFNGNSSVGIRECAFLGFLLL